MQPKKPDRSVPQRIAQDNEKLEIEGYVALHVGDYKRAAGLFDKQYVLLLNAQTEGTDRFKKAHPSIMKVLPSTMLAKQTLPSKPSYSPTSRTH